jgi:hypothetical protein
MSIFQFAWSSITASSIAGGIRQVSHLRRDFAARKRLHFAERRPNIELRRAYLICHPKYLSYSLQLQAGSVAELFKY